MAEENAIRSKIILGGVEEFRENLRLAKEDVKEFNDSLQSANNSIEPILSSENESSFPHSGHSVSNISASANISSLS